MFSAEPWKVSPNNPRSVLAGYRGVLEIYAGTEANARLIAQAPTAHQLVREALQALEHADHIIGADANTPEIDIRDWIKAVRAYLAAVEGRD